MKYCVVKNTIKIIDGSENPKDIMLLNAINAGFNPGPIESEVEILTEEELEARKALEPVVQQPLTEEQQRLLDLETAMTQILGGTV